jgi:hypothetical protein
VSVKSRGSPQPKPIAGPLAPERRWTDADGTHIDVRGLIPPGPLVAILALVESIADPSPVIVHHDRDPKLLYPELAELGWVAVPLDAPEGEVRLKLERAP